MFAPTHIAYEAEYHRQELLADARNFRLARLARAARRVARTHGATARPVNRHPGRPGHHATMTGTTQPGLQHDTPDGRDTTPR